MSNSIYTSKNTRAPLPDLLKGLAVIFMIQVHIMELFALQEIYDSYIGDISLFLGGPPAAPLFMAIMGYFLFFSSKTFNVNIKRGLLIIAAGILLNIGLNFHLLINIFTGLWDMNPYPYIFGADILPLAGMSIIIISFLNKNNFEKENKLYKYCSLFLLFLMLSVLYLTYALNEINAEEYSLLSYMQAFFFGTQWWSYFPLFPWLFYPLLGYAVAIITTNYKINLNPYVTIIILLIILIATFTYVIEQIITLPLYYHHSFLLAMWITLFLILIYQVAAIKEKYLGSTKLFYYIKWIGKHVTLFYIIQWLIIGNIATAIFKTQPLYTLPLWFLLILTATTLLTYFTTKYSKIKLF